MKYWAPLPASSPVISTCRGMSNFGLYTENDNLILHTLLPHRCRDGNEGQEKHSKVRKSLFYRI